MANEKLKALLKAADDLMVDAECAARNPNEMNLRVLQIQVDAYNKARNAYDMGGLETLISDAKPGPTNNSTNP